MFIQVNGGIGKQYAIIPAIKEYKKQNKDETITILTPYPVVYRNLLTTGVIDNVFFYELNGLAPKHMLDYIKLNKLKYIIPEPYLEQEFIQGENYHISQLYYKTLGLPIPEKIPEYSLELNEDKIFESRKFLESLNTPIDKIILFQPFGGNVKPEEDERALDHPTALKIYEQLLLSGYKVLIISNNPDIQKYFQGTFIGDLEMIMYFLSVDVKMIAIDSSPMHLTNTTFVRKTRKKEALIFWSKTRIENFGYKFNKNLKLKNLPEGCPCQRTFGIPFDGHICIYNKACRAWNPETILKIVKDYVEGVTK